MKPWVTEGFIASMENKGRLRIASVTNSSDVKRNEDCCKNNNSYGTILSQKINSVNNDSFGKL